MSTIIKASNASADSGAPYNFEDMTHRADQYLDHVRQQAAEILTRAQQEAEGIRRQAEEQGAGQALEAAHRVFEEKRARQLNTLLPALREAVDQVQASRAGWLAHWEKTAIHVAAAIAARLVRRELAHQPEITLDLVKEALELASGCDDVQVRLHPDDFAALGPQVERLVGELSRLGNVHVVADPQITAGGCRVDTRFGSIDQQFEAQLARIEQELT